MMQSPRVANYFQTLGYLVPIISVLAMVIMPRGKFMMNLLLNTLAICIGSAVSMLALWSAVKAREHTAPPNAGPEYARAYNSKKPNRVAAFVAKLGLDAPTLSQQ